MITTLGKYISNNLSREVRESNYFTILADKAADISNKEHLAVVIRFVDSGKNIHEEFVGFYLCEGGTAGVAIKEHILQASADLGGYQWMIAEDSVMMALETWPNDLVELHHLSDKHMRKPFMFTV